MSSNAETHYDVIVIGGGASGMMSASRACARGRRVLLIEKNDELGKKLSRTGGGRCNITNAESDTRVFLSHYGTAAKFLHAPFSQFGVQQTFDFFTHLGLPLIVEDRKRAFPKTESAIDVTRVLSSLMKKAGVEVLMDTKVKNLLLRKNVLVGVATSRGDFFGTSIVLATGGSSYQETGSTGEGISWLIGLGYRIHNPSPDIVPLKVKEGWVKKLAGKSLTTAAVSFTVGKKTIQKMGKILFTHFGLSGPCVLNSSGEVKKMLALGDVQAKIDLFPQSDVHTLDLTLRTYFDLHKNKTVRNALKEFVAPGMVDAILSQNVSVVPTLKVHNLTKAERLALTTTCKNLVCTITDTMGYDWAVVSDGGVDLNDIDTKTMASKLHPNLFFTGDVLHINRPSGGYSLQLCWTTGWVAGNHV